MKSFQSFMENDKKEDDKEIKKEPPLKCLKCHKPQENLHKLKRHYVDVHFKIDIFNYLCENSSNNDDDCPVCKRPFKNKWNMVEHFAIAHDKIVDFVPKDVKEQFQALE